MNLTEYVKEAHKIAQEHGWWDEDRPLTECLLLVHCELSEAVEELRKEPFTMSAVNEELADVFIRMFDLCGKYCTDIERVVQWKMEKNKKRPYKHGKAF